MAGRCPAVVGEEETPLRIDGAMKNSRRISSVQPCPLAIPRFQRAVISSVDVNSKRYVIPGHCAKNRPAASGGPKRCFCCTEPVVLQAFESLERRCPVARRFWLVAGGNMAEQSPTRRPGNLTSPPINIPSEIPPHHPSPFGRRIAYEIARQHSPPTRRSTHTPLTPPRKAADRTGGPYRGTVLRQKTNGGGAPAESRVDDQ